MPQTEEEHLENQYLDYEDREKKDTDAEVSSRSLRAQIRPISFGPSSW